MPSFPDIPLTHDEILELIVYPGLWAVVLLALAWQPWHRRRHPLGGGAWAWALVLPLAVWLMAKDINGRVPAFTKFGGTPWLYWIACGLVAVSLADALLRLPAWVRVIGGLLVAATACLGVAWNLVQNSWTIAQSVAFVGGPAVLVVIHALSIDRFSRRQPGWVVPFIYMTTAAAATVVVGTSGSKNLADFATLLASLLGGAWLVGIAAPWLSMARGGGIAVATLLVMILACNAWLSGTPRLTDLALVAAAPLAAWGAYLVPGVRGYQRIAALVAAAVTLAVLAWPVYVGLRALARMAAEGLI